MDRNGVEYSDALGQASAQLAASKFSETVDHLTMAKLAIGALPELKGLGGIEYSADNTLVAARPVGNMPQEHTRTV